MSHIRSPPEECCFDTTILTEGFEYGSPYFWGYSIFTQLYGLNSAKSDQAHFVLFPELFLPRSLLNTHIRAICEENNFIIIGGLEYGPETADNSDKTTPLENEAFIAIPSRINSVARTTRSYCTIIQIPKIMPAEEEETFIKKCGYSFRRGNRLHIFRSSYLGNWAVLICVDFLNLPIHVMLQSAIQTLFVVSYNTDVNGYSSIADTMQRLLMCNIVICNIGKYGSSLAYSPYRKDYRRQRLRIIGNDIDTAVTIKVPLRHIVTAQQGGRLYDADDQQLFIKRPPDYGQFHIIRKDHRS